MRPQFAHRPVQGLLELELLQEHLHPETDGKQPFGNQLGRLGRAPQTPAWGTIATGTITVTHVSAAHQVHLPFDLLTGLRQARGGPKLAADRAGALRLSQGVMGGLFGQMQTPVPFGAWAARLLPPASWGPNRSTSPKRLRVASDLHPNCCFFSQANCRLRASICCPYQPTHTTNCARSFSAVSA